MPRPKLPTGCGKSAKFHTRLRPATLERIALCAEKNGVSISEEISSRLERSFLMDDVVSYLRSRDED